ncbi:MAG: hypothetical protein ACFCU6_02990 [Balneolaceae bacterium]
MGCASDRQEQSSQEQFFSLLQDLCGEEFEGDTVFPDDPEHDFYDAELYMKIESCTDNEIRIPFYVNDDRSRTWVITRTDQGLLLKHDHRDPETGIEHDLTQYGGYSNVHGAANVQYFEADDETAEMLPEASTNVWMLEVNPEEGKFVYYLERHDQPRYRAEFRLKKRE